MNLSPLWVAHLKAHGYDAVHWSHIGAGNAPDTEIFDYASIHGFVIFTHDLDFGTLLARRRTRQPSVLQLRSQEVLPSVAATLVLAALGATHEQLESGALVTIDAHQRRLRILPI